MGFLTRKRTPETAEELNGLDRLTQAAALNLSRRGFLRKIPALGVGVSLGLAGARTVQAGECWTEVFKDENARCGSCLVEVRPGCETSGRVVKTRSRECCKTDAGAAVCDSWPPWSTSCTTDGCGAPAC